MAQATSRTPNRTFRGPAGAGAPRLSSLPGVDRAEVAPRQVLEIERYDTDDHRLAAAGVVLAFHQGTRDGEQAQWRLDLAEGEGGEHLRVPLAADAGNPPAVPGELAALVRGIVRERALRPSGRIRRVRIETRLLGAGDRLFATVVHDHVTVATLGRSTDVESWTDVELRPAAADNELVTELEQRITESGLQKADTDAETELDRLMRPASPPARKATPGKPGSAGAALVDYIAEHTGRLAAEDLRVRRGEPDAVHQMRVASRRVRSALQAFRRLLDREKIDPLVDELRELGRALAPARDAEVLRERISEGLRDLDPELRMGSAEQQVTRHFARREAEAGAAVLSTLDSERYARLRTALDDLVRNPPFTKRARRPARKELPRLVARTARRLERAAKTALDPARPAEERDEAVHAARKAGKRLRYATEVAEPAVGKDAKRFAKTLKGFQTALGEHQDTVVARDALRELGALAHSGGENGFSFGVLHGKDAERAARIEEDLPRLWKKAWTRRNRRWLR